MNQDTICAIQGYQMFFGLTGKLLYSFPEQGMLDELVSNQVFFDFPIDSQDPRFHDGAALLKKWSCQYADAQKSNAAFSDIRVDATRLFAGYQSILTPPWESVYFNKERMIFQRETQEVRAWYTRHGLELVQKNHEPDDHIGLELDFIAHLLQRALESNSEEEQQRLVSEACMFANEHPTRWVDQWAALVAQEAQTDYYRGLALTVAAAVKDFAEGL